MARGKYSGTRFDDYDLIDVTGSAPGVVFADAPDADDAPVDDVDDGDEPEGDEDSGTLEDGGSADVAQPYNPTAALRGFLYRMVAPPDQKPPRPARPTRSAPAANRKPVADLVNGLDRRERIISLVLAALAFSYVVAVLIVNPQPQVHPPKGTLYIAPWVLALVVGLPAIGIGVGVAIARRALVGFLAVLEGFAVLSLVGVYGLLYFALGVWLIMRASRYSKQVRAASGAPTPTPTRRARADRPARSSEGGSSARAAGKSTSRPAAKASSSGVVPAKSKRYTPPRSATAGRRRTPTS